MARLGLGITEVLVRNNQALLLINKRDRQGQASQSLPLTTVGCWRLGDSAAAEGAADATGVLLHASKTSTHQGVTHSVGCRGGSRDPRPPPVLSCRQGARPRSTLVPRAGGPQAVPVQPQLQRPPAKSPASPSAAAGRPAPAFGQLEPQRCLAGDRAPPRVGWWSAGTGVSYQLQDPFQGSASGVTSSCPSSRTGRSRHVMVGQEV